MPKHTRKAYNYSRLSNTEQRKGRGKSRQRDPVAELCERKGWILDQSLDLHEEMSAFHGDNATIGKLGAFLQAVDEEVVERGSILIVESLDRLSRDEVPAALELFLGILRRGIDIVTFLPDEVHFSYKTLDTTQLIIAIIILARAHDESAHKSKRHKDNWQGFRERMRQGQPIGNICPKWLRVSENGKSFVKIKEKVRVILQIVRLYKEGKGTHTIAELLNEQGARPLMHGKPSKGCENGIPMRWPRSCKTSNKSGPDCENG